MIGMLDTINEKYSNFVKNQILCTDEYKDNKSKLTKLSMKNSENILAKAAGIVLEKNDS